jgi:hypothetical protein
MTIRLLATAITAAVVLAGCNARSAAGLPEGSHVEGGYGTHFYAEVVKPVEGGKPRIILFSSLAHFDEYVKKGEVKELGHKKFIGAGANRETLVVDTTGMIGADGLVARYKARHGK